VSSASSSSKKFKVQKNSRFKKVQVQKSSSSKSSRFRKFKVQKVQGSILPCGRFKDLGNSFKTQL